MKTKLEGAQEKKIKQNQEFTTYEGKKVQIKAKNKRNDSIWVSVTQGYSICGRDLAIHSHAVYILYLYYTSGKNLK